MDKEKLLAIIDSAEYQYVKKQLQSMIKSKSALLERFDINEHVMKKLFVELNTLRQIENLVEDQIAQIDADKAIKDTLEQFRIN